MQVCVKRNICLNLCGWQIYWILFFIDVIITFFLIHNSLQLSLRGSFMERLVHVHVLVNAQQHCSCEYRRAHQYRKSHMCPLEFKLMRRNYCRSVISLQEPLPNSLWISLDLYGILAIVWTPAYAVVSICVCWPPKRRVYNIASSSLLHRKYLLLLCCLLRVSQYRLALIDSLCPHCQGYLPAYP